jgi:hypothetical protein
LSGVGLVGTAAIVAAIGAGPLLVAGADHLDAPFAKKDARIDITDIYAFSNGTGTALVLNVNPLMTPAATKVATFRPYALYQFKIDTDGDARADIAYRLRFSGVQRTPGGATFQDYAVRMATGASASADAWTGKLLLGNGRSSAYGGAIRSSVLSGGGRSFVGPRDDPFYFDLAGFVQFKSKLLAGSTDLDELLGGFTGTDTFRGTNISSIVLSVPNGMVGGTGRSVGVWATTAIPNGSGGYIQVEQMARPAINTVFNHSDATKERFNRSRPTVREGANKAAVVGVLDAIGNVLSANSLPAYSATTKAAIADVLVPDTLTYKVGDPSGFLNGRRLANDVIDAELSLLTNGNVTSDGVDGNDARFGAFPFLAAPH